MCLCIPSQDGQIVISLARKLTIVGSCNDFLLYRAHAEDLIFDKIQLFISNIQTKQWLALPCLRLNNFTHSSVKIGLICDPYYTCINGNVALNNACQACVVAIPCTPEAVTEFRAYLLSTNSSGGVWRNVLLSLPLRCQLVAFRGLFCSIGRLLYFHCLTSITHAPQLISFDPFDVDNDVIKCNALLLPEGLMSSSSFFGVFHEQLYVCDYSDNGFYRVRVLEDCKIGQWSLRHNIKWCDWIYGDRCHAKLVNQRPWFGYPIGFHPASADIIYVRCDNCIVSCNFSSRKMEFVSELPECRRSMSPLFNHLFQITLPVWPTPLPTF